MIVATALVSGLTALFLADTTVALDPIANPSLNAALLLAPNAVTRESILSNSDYFYDFANCTYSTFDPGSVCNADKATWPILTNAPITITQLQLGPCSLLPAHFHRADNAVVAINGTTHTFMYPEDGGETVEQYLSAGQMTLFPRMSLHTMVNEGCTSNLLYSFLPNNDAGRLTPLSPLALWSFGYDLVAPLLPGILTTDSSAYAATIAQLPQVGTGAIYGLKACRQRCGISTDGTGEGEAGPGNGSAAEVKKVKGKPRR